MGQAKRRGTKEERVKKAIEKAKKNNKNGSFNPDLKASVILVVKGF